jgi:hypothetical protein
VPVEAGSTYVVAADASGSGGRVALEQLSATGQVLPGLRQTLGVLPVGFSQTIDDTVTIADGATSVRLRLEGGLTGPTSFDDVRLWRQ